MSLDVRVVKRAYVVFTVLRHDTTPVFNDSVEKRASSRVTQFALVITTFGITSLLDTLLRPLSADSSGSGHGAKDLVIAHDHGSSRPQP